MEFVLTTEQTITKADELVDHLRRPRLWVPGTDYPDYGAWLERVHRQLKDESKRAILALVRGCVIGAVLYQRHKTAPWALELKNVSVAPDLRGRHVASFLLRNAEIEGRADYGSMCAVVDTKASNSAMRRFLSRNGYRASITTDLYGLGAGEDVLYAKRIGATACRG